MRGILGIPLLCALLLIGMPSTYAADIIFFKNGKTAIDGEVTNLDKGLVLYTKKFEGRRASVSYALKEIERVEFGNLGELLQLSKEVDSKDNIDVLTVLRKHAKFMAVPKSNVGELVLAFAKKKASVRKAVEMKAAAQLANGVLEKDWDATRRLRARQLLLELTVFSGEETIDPKNHQQDLESTTLYLEMGASFIKAKALILEYQALIEENPRWKRDPIVRKKRNALYFEIFDLLLAPVWGFNSPPEVASLCLREISQFHVMTGNMPNAVSVATDITVIYPQTQAFEWAQTFLSEQQNKDTP